ncbi:MAG: 23S rRNA (pseudouridine(1915)-N(3))-methyltransferase RlmH [Candidatus Contendobacter odensis]|uniref:Ribosomal RNA large subunit methyltransferase H n=1 Tax=Candidatus Contendibacter odensensis TaxID=1400860 RepID=A0A2G6PEL8_9GAMM|nr:MAG: 23S rRNA (pseudouridine(1915)-N(3))-methyltransferase RlmH [Candidatus Contendobacter odensis]
MKIHLLAVGRRMPAWVQTAYTDYTERLSRECTLHLIEIPAAKRGNHPGLARLIHAEGVRLLNAVPTGSRIIALDERGQEWSTAQLAKKLSSWLNDGRNPCLLVGGPDGLAPDCRERAECCWSLSKLTLPHPLVRVVIAEQIYRAWSLLHNHPYHRA